MPRNVPTEMQTAEASPTTRPVHLYIVEYRGEIMHFCNYDVPVTVTGLPVSKGADPQTFNPGAIAHTALDQSNDTGSNRIEITVALNNSDFTNQLQRMILFTSPDKITITVVRVNSKVLPAAVVWSEDTFVVFKGRATHLTFGGGQINIGLVSILLAGDGKVPSKYWQKACQHDLYNSLCGADPESPANRLQTVVAERNSRLRTVDFANTAIDGDPILAHTFQYGRMTERDLTYDGTILSRITIISTEILPSSAGVRLYLAWWSPTLKEGSLIEVLRGCRRIVADCQFFHPGTPTTELPFLGFPWIPDVSPAIHGI